MVPKFKALTPVGDDEGTECRKTIGAVQRGVGVGGGGAGEGN